jgi:hypothetical protein
MHVLGEELTQITKMTTPNHTRIIKIYRIYRTFRLIKVLQERNESLLDKRTITEVLTAKRLPFSMRGGPTLSLFFRTCITHEQLKLANLLSPRYLNRTSKKVAEINSLARLSRGDPQEKLLQHKLSRQKRTLLLR